MIARFALAAFVALGALTANALPPDSIYQLGDTYTDQNGKDFKLSERKGRVQVVSMFYGTCRFACPLIVASMNAVRRELPKADQGQVDLMLVSFDPERDTVEALAKYYRDRRLDSNAWTFARSSSDAVRKLAAILDIRYRQRDDLEFDHANVLVLLDREGRIKARTSEIGQEPDPEFMKALRAELAQGKKSPTP